MLMPNMMFFSRKNGLFIVKNSSLGHFATGAKK
jgi:hypothetical protein